MTYELYIGELSCWNVMTVIGTTSIGFTGGRDPPYIIAVLWV